MRAFLGRMWGARHKYLRLLKYILSIQIVPHRRSAESQKGVVVVHFGRQLKYRFVEQILRTLAASGFSINYYVGSLADIIRLGRLEGDLFWTPGIEIIYRLPKNTENHILCCDDDTDPLLRVSWKKIFKLEFDLAKPYAALSQPIHIPFSVHDYIYRACFHKRPALLGNPKKIRLLFAGAYKGYAGGPIGSQLGKLERAAIVEIFRNHPNTSIIVSQAELDAVLAGPPSTRFYWVDTSKFRIPPEQWLDVLSYVEVFLCPPGVMTPMSYNAVESIAMGAIPLINYPEWFHPRLRDGDTCVAFTDAASLRQQLDALMNTPDANIARMRARVLAYYQEYLALDAVVARIQAANGPLVNLVMDAEQADCTNRVTAHSLAIAAD